MRRRSVVIVDAPLQSRRNIIHIDGVIAIIKDKHGIADCLINSLKQRGYAAHVCESNTVPENARALIFLMGLNHYKTMSEASAVNKEAFHAVKQVAQQFSEQGGLFVTVQDTGGRFATTTLNSEQAWLAGLPGLVKTAALEWPKASCKAIDIACQTRDNTQVAEQLYQEIFCGGFETEVGLLADGKRVTPDVIQQENLTGTLQLSQDDVIVISGGARGVTTTSLLALCQQAKPRVVLLGRNTLDDIPACCMGLTQENEIRAALVNDYRQKQQKISPQDINRLATKIMHCIVIKDNLQKFTQLGIDVIYYPVDIMDVEALGNVLNKVRTHYGKITGIVHGAGVLQDKLITQKTAEQFNHVFNTKVIGLQNLLAKTQQDPLTFIGLFSSVAGRYGNFGQCDYAMANEVLNKVAQQEQLRRGKTCIVKSYNWGPWDAGMVSEGLKQMFAERGIALLASDDGAQLFVDELKDTSTSQVEMVLGSLETTSQSLQKYADMIVQPNEKPFSITVQKKSHAFLSDHQIKGVTVVPIALVLEWLSQAARHYYPNLKLRHITTLEVLHPLQLIKFPKKAYTFQIQPYQHINEKPFQVTLVLSDESEKRYYSAVVEMSAEKNPARHFILPVEKSANWDLAIEKIYQENSNTALFHGKQLHVIQSLDSVSEHGGSGTLVGLKTMGWPTAHWDIDVAAIDGALQLLVLWGIRTFGKITLPLSMDSFINYQTGPITGKMHCHFTARRVNQFTALHDVFLLDEKKQLIAEMSNVTMCLVPSEQPAKQTNIEKESCHV